MAVCRGSGCCADTRDRKTGRMRRYHLKDTDVLALRRPILQPDGAAVAPALVGLPGVSPLGGAGAARYRLRLVTVLIVASALPGSAGDLRCAAGGTAGG
jgi:hypothetical protein